MSLPFPSDVGCSGSPCTPPLRDLEATYEKDGIALAYLPLSKRLKSTAGTIVQRCLREIEKFRNRMNKNVCVYKLGLTSGPSIRFEYYKEGNYTHMTLLHVTHNLGEAQMLEACLIAIHMGQHGCRNERYGGDGPPGTSSEPHHFVYVVGARADDRKSIK